MAKKSVAVAVILGVFGFGGFYAAGLKKGLLLFLVTCIICWVGALASQSAAILGNVVCVCVSYKWAKEYNESLSGGSGQA